jgi:hypothetical protein
MPNQLGSAGGDWAANQFLPRLLLGQQDGKAKKRRGGLGGVRFAGGGFMRIAMGGASPMATRMPTLPIPPDPVAPLSSGPKTV